MEICNSRVIKGYSHQIKKRNLVLKQLNKMDINFLNHISQLPISGNIVLPTCAFLKVH